MLQAGCAITTSDLVDNSPFGRGGWRALLTAGRVACRPVTAASDSTPPDGTGYDALIFDWDGTLVDFPVESFCSALQSALAPGMRPGLPGVRTTG
jgi:hypothetical protein